MVGYSKGVPWHFYPYYFLEQILEVASTAKSNKVLKVYYHGDLQPIFLLIETNPLGTVS